MNSTLTPNELFCDLHIAATMVIGVEGSIPTSENLALLYRAIINIEATIKDGLLPLECVHRDDLKSIQKLLEKGIERIERRYDRLVMEGV